MVSDFLNFNCVYQRSWTDVGGKHAELRPKLFMYELPDHFSKCAPGMNMETWQFYNYGAEVMIPRWLNKSTFLTTDPEEADLFYVPALFYCASTASGNGGLGTHISKRLINIIQTLNSNT